LDGSIWVTSGVADAAAIKRSASFTACALYYGRSGELLVVPTSHCQELAALTIDGEGWAAAFEMDRVCAAIGAMGVRDGTVTAVSHTWSTSRRLSVPPHDRLRWEAHLTRLQAELDRPTAGSDAVATALLALLLIDAARLVTGGGTAPAQPRKLLADVAAVIEAHYHRPLSLADVARSVAISPSHLNRVVRQSTGHTVGAWILDRRMEESRRLLLETDRTIESIATSVGYRDLTHFRRHFRRAHRTTPGRWRERARPELARRTR
jgi:AraC-like DNA-binding protein